jgi:hypothetical protein
MAGSLDAYDSSVTLRGGVSGFTRHKIKCTHVDVRPDLYLH